MRGHRSAACEDPTGRSARPRAIAHAALRARSGARYCRSARAFRRTLLPLCARVQAHATAALRARSGARYCRELGALVADSRFLRCQTPLVEIDSSGGRWSSRALLLVSILPYLVLATGIGLSLALDGSSTGAEYGFLAGGVAALVVIRIGRSLIDMRDWPAEPGHIRVLSGIASQLYLTRAYLTRRAAVAHISALVTLIVAWTPWFAFWASASS